MARAKLFSSGSLALGCATTVFSVALCAAALATEPETPYFFVTDADSAANVAAPSLGAADAPATSNEAARIETPTASPLSERFRKIERTRPQAGKTSSRRTFKAAETISTTAEQAPPAEHTSILEQARIAEAQAPTKPAPATPFPAVRGSAHRAPVTAAPVKPAPVSAAPVNSAQGNPFPGSGVRQATFLRTDPAKHAVAPLNAKPEVETSWQVPETLNVGQTAACQLTVRNTGRAAATFVAVEFDLPQNVGFVNAEPAAEQFGETLHWLLGDLPAGASRQVTVGLIPQASGSITPQARVTFSQAATAEIRVLEPKIEVALEALPTMMVGQTASLTCRVHNSGTGAAVDLQIQAQLGAGLQHSQGELVQYRIGTLGPDETRQIELRLTALEPGPTSVLVAASSNEAVLAEDEKSFEIIRPELALSVEGPKFRYVDRKATLKLTLANPGVSPADNVELIVPLPEGLGFVQARPGGSFELNGREVRWFIGRLEPQQSVQAELEVLAQSPGELEIAATARADADAVCHAATQLRVESAAAVVLDVTDADDPIEVSGETTLEIRVSNNGSRAATQVEVAATLPAEMELISVEGPVDGRCDGTQLVFDPLESLEAGESQSFLLHVKCTTAGRARLRAYYRSAEQERPVIEEEVTQIYAD